MSSQNDNGKDPSPTNVTCIDLTNSSDDESDREQDDRLGDVRKRLNGSARKNNGKGAAGRKTTGLNNNDDDSSSNGDNGILAMYTAAGQWSCHVCTYNNWNANSTSCEMCGTAKADNDEAMKDAEEGQKTHEEDSADGDSKPAAKKRSGGPDGTTAKQNFKKVKTEGMKKTNGNINNNLLSQGEDGVEVVAPTAPKLVPATPTARAGDDGDDDVVLEGVINETRLPHMRQHCTKFPFDPTQSNYIGEFSSVTIDKNSQSCDLCYCYVCDVPQSECEKWNSTTCPRMKFNHCCAQDHGAAWGKLRSEAKAQKETALAAASAAPGQDSDDDDDDDGDSNETPPRGRHFSIHCTTHHCRYGPGPCASCWCYVCDKAGTDCSDFYMHRYANPTCDMWRKERALRKLRTYGESGPWEPEDENAVADSVHDVTLIQCRHCNWWIRQKAVTFRKEASAEDWCLQCGLVASQKDLEKNQDNNAVAADQDQKEDKAAALDPPMFLLGTKTIPFTIKAHDPRKISTYKQKWQNFAQIQGWTYDEASQQEEVFLHRLGTAPTLSKLLQLVPLSVEKKIPTEITEESIARIDKTDAVIIKDRKNTHLLNMLRRLPEMNGETKISAFWEAQKQAGTIKVELYLPNSVFVGPTGRTPVYTENYNRNLNRVMPCVLGLWFDGVFPLTLTDMAGPLLKPELKPSCLEHAKSVSSPSSTKIKIAVNPYSVEQSDLSNFFLKISKSFRPFMAFYAKDRKEKNDALSLVGSDVCRYQGGTSPTPSADDLSLDGCLRRFFGEHLHQMVKTPCVTLLAGSCHGLNSIHDNTFSTEDQILAAVLGLEKAIAAKAMLSKDAMKARDFRSSHFTDSRAIVKTMRCLENLGHESEPFVEGLTIDLLPFQKQSLKWAIEREQTPGGVQKYWWPKLPPSEGRGDLYYCPILNMMRKDPPRIVRGGVIAQEMGLGKTILSLGIHLKNPAPLLPVSGSKITELDKVSGNLSTARKSNVAWDKDLYKGTSADNPKRGSVIGRGSLIVCPVSLVGQWIDEAKSKLEDPGLVYAYHGQSRKRNANVLAKHSIVVTTYNVLSSDKFYHSEKAGAGNGYCAPLETIRWWRIIYDEGHCLRDASTKLSKAASDLVSDNRWIVTGTPMSTCMTDLKNQLKCLGIEYADRLFSAMIKGESARHGGGFCDIESLMYLLRPIVLRHSQKMTYRGSQTTLMQLPKKTERTVMVQLASAEKKEYGTLEKEAQDWYINFRAAHLHDMSKHFLNVSSKLLPMREACSGGKYPIGSTTVGVGNNNADNAKDDEEDADATPKRRTETVLSNFAFTSKLKILLHELEQTKESDPTSKSLVFSQYKTTLDWLKEELPRHGFQFRSLSGDMSMNQRAKALHDFQKDPPTTIFLLSMRAGAVGINLTQANRVYIMEPHFNPGVEAQAIGRVHRLGQKREVEIIRLIVENSVESRMLKFLNNKYCSSTGAKSELQEEDKDGSDSFEKQADVKEEKKPAAKKKKEIDNIVVGNIRTEKAQANTDQFDALFGVVEQVQRLQEKQQDKDMPDAAAAATDGGPAPDHVWS